MGTLDPLAQTAQLDPRDRLVRRVSPVRLAAQDQRDKLACRVLRVDQPDPLVPQDPLVLAPSGQRAQPVP